jgi:hypothetical protein
MTNTASPTTGLIPPASQPVRKSMSAYGAQVRLVAGDVVGNFDELWFGGKWRWRGQEGLGAKTQKRLQRH